ncbi:hypothetical protein BSR29_06530 [Boudabousia liubingyangii]|uniref:3-phosphoshikimate 1-carboxyvinyltransferase n=1 Tax=Boudabousia liubingyangii TaxID=1921764 RepID=A0A1Q5PKU9_9ACTO|nr:3-phosphoshikimate 1-carboxyvinyltransferase [Boudabousia liubingyangii]OKL47269.1 hypothetical protein BSR29_06530 [Boudabousia liubingyangii]
MPTWNAPSVNTPIAGALALPGSKSLTNRFLILAAQGSHEVTIQQPLEARDTQLMQAALGALGASFDFDDKTQSLRIVPINKQAVPKELTIEGGLAGTVIRFLTPLALQYCEKLTVLGDPAARKRPIRPLLNSLAQLGYDFEVFEEPVPDEAGPVPLFEVRKSTPLNAEDTSPNRVDVEAKASSQFLSALLLSAAGWPQGLEICAKRPIISGTHVDMTLDSLTQAGITLQVEETAESVTYRVAPGRPQLDQMTVEADLSNAGPFIAAIWACGGKLAIPNWPAQTTQAGDYWRELFSILGGKVSTATEDHGQGAVFTAPEGLRTNEEYLEFDLQAHGELTPTLAAMAALRQGKTKITGIGHLRGHETDRLAAIVNEVKRLGGEAEAGEDFLLFHAPVTTPAQVHAYHDHRMATFGAIIGLVLPGVQVDDIDATTKTMPTFKDLWAQLVAPALPESNLSE